MNNLRSFPLCVLASAFLCSVVALAQQAAPAARIVSPLDESNLITLKGNTNPHANAMNDRGAVSPEFALPDLTLVLSRSPEQQAAFDAFVASQYESGSPNFHQWLTPGQIGAQFGPAPADIATITGWLTTHGFTVKQVAPDRMTIRFSGTAAEVESAFHTQIHNLLVNGVPHYANMSDPQIPAALAPVVLGVKRLHSFLPRPEHKLGSVVKFNKAAGKWQRIVNSAPAGSNPTGASSKPAFIPRPLFGINDTSTGSSFLEEDVTPYDFATIYNVLPLWQESTPINGTGETIAIAGTSEICLGQANSACETTPTSGVYNNDVAAYRSAFDLPKGLTPIQIDTGDGAPASVCTSSSAACGFGDLMENSLDVEVSGAVAPGAQIDLVVTGQAAACNTTTGSGCIDTVYDSAAYIVNHATARIMSLSYGECELGNGTAENVAYYDLWQTAASAGISVFVSTGDAGSPSCDDSFDTFYGNPYVAQFGLSVNGLASTPFNTAVGGTDFSWCQPYFDSNGNFLGCATSSTGQGGTAGPAYWATSNNATTGESALGYVPEIPWNDTCENPIQARYIETYLSASGFDSFAGVNPTTPEETCNVLYNDWLALDNGSGASGYFESLVDTVGGSGGVSGCVVNTTNASSNPYGDCTAGSTSTGATTNPDTGAAQSSITLVNNGWPVPSWQSGITGTSGLTTRAIPDVSFFAGNGAFSSSTLVCVSVVPNVEFGLSPGCTYPATAATSTDEEEYTAQELGGTSVASPEMAGVMALINQKAGGAQGLANYELYDLAARQTYSSCSAESVTTSSSCYFNDIDNGPTAASGTPAYTTAQTISMPCSLTNGTVEGGNGNGPDSGAAGVASPNCYKLNSGDTIGTLATSASSGAQAYNSTTGFDLATGLGSLNVANVVNAWPAGAFAPTFALSATSVSVAAGATTGNTSTITVAPSDGFTGTVGFTCSVTTTPANPTSPVTCGTIASADVTGSAETTTTMTVGSTSSTTGGAYVITVTGKNGSITQIATVNVTVTAVVVTPAYTVAATSPSSGIAPGSNATSTVTATGSGGYAGSITLTCSLNPGGPSNSSGDAPSCSVTSGSPVTLSAMTTSGQATATVTTVMASTADLVYPKSGNSKGWLGAGGGAALALLVFFGIPARRRSWRKMLCLLAAMVGLGVLASCGGGVSGGGGGGNTGTAAGTYTFTVTSSGNPAVTPTPTATFKVIVN